MLQLLLAKRKNERPEVALKQFWLELAQSSIDPVPMMPEHGAEIKKIVHIIREERLLYLYENTNF
jgi:hypothetical protein